MNENFDFNSVKNTSDLSEQILIADLKTKLRKLIEESFCSATQKIVEQNGVLSVIEGALEGDEYNQTLMQFNILSPEEVSVYTNTWLLNITRNVLKFIAFNKIHFTFYDKKDKGTVLTRISFYNHPVNNYENFIPINQQLLDKMTFVGYDEYVISNVVFAELDDYLYLTMHFDSIMSKHENSVYGDGIKILNHLKPGVTSYIDNRTNYKDPSNIVIQTYDNYTKKIYNKVEEAFDFNAVQSQNMAISGALLDNCMNYDDLPEDKKQFEFFSSVALKFKKVFDRWNENKKSKWEYRPDLKQICVWNDDASKPYAHLIYNDDLIIKQISFDSDNFPINWSQSICYYKYEFIRQLYDELNPYCNNYTRMITSNYQVNTIRNNPFVIGIDFDCHLDLSNLKKVIKFIMNSIPILGYMKTRVNIKGLDNINHEQLKQICNELTNYFVKVTCDNSVDSETYREVASLCNDVNPTITPYKDEQMLYDLYIDKVNMKFHAFLKKNNIPLSEIYHVTDPKLTIAKQTIGWDSYDYVIEIKYFFIYKEKSCTVAFTKTVDNLNLKQIENTRWEMKPEIYQ